MRKACDSIDCQRSVFVFLAIFFVFPHFSKNLHASSFVERMKVSYKLGVVRKQQARTREKVLAELTNIRNLDLSTSEAHISFSHMRNFDCEFRRYDFVERKIDALIQKFSSDPIRYNKLVGLSSPSFVTREDLRFSPKIKFSPEDVESLLQLHHRFPGFNPFMSTLFYIKYYLNQNPGLAALENLPVASEVIPIAPGLPIPSAPPQELVDYMDHDHSSLSCFREDLSQNLVSEIDSNH